MSSMSVQVVASRGNVDGGAYGSSYAHILKFRRTSFDMTEITVRVLGPADPTPTPETYTDEPNQPVKTG